MFQASSQSMGLFSGIFWQLEIIVFTWEGAYIAVSYSIKLILRHISFVVVKRSAIIQSSLTCVISFSKAWCFFTWRRWKLAWLGRMIINIIPKRRYFDASLLSIHCWKILLEISLIILGKILLRSLLRFSLS